MGRPRAFDEDAVLTGAMEAFRRKGFLAVSIRELEQATGLKAGSIYHGFGDKDGLFRAAMEHYNRVVLDARLAEHAPESAGLDGLRRLFMSLMHEPENTSFGCLITNSAVEFGGAAEVPEGIDAGLHTLFDVFKVRLSVARRAGTLRADIKPAHAATRLLSLYQGILVLVRAGWDKAALTAMVRDEFKQMENE